MSQTKILCTASVISIVLLAALIKARDLAASMVHDWPVKITETPDFGITIHADDVRNGSPEERHLTQAEPFILCRALRKYPVSKYHQFSIEWNSVAAQGETLTVELKYSRSAKSLSITSFYPVGGTRGTSYTNVTDDKIFHIVDAAGTFGQANFKDLKKLGCGSKWL